MLSISKKRRNPFLKGRNTLSFPDLIWWAIPHINNSIKNKINK